MKRNAGQGDDGQTHTIGGSKIPKDSLRIEAVGVLDELGAVLGCAVAFVKEGVVQQDLQHIQRNLILLSSDIATPALSDPAVKEDAVKWIEESIDKYEMMTKVEIKDFVFPGETRLGAFLHLARAVTRRAERRVISISRRENIEGDSIRFLNRLSDLFFQIAVFVDTI